MLPDIPTEHHPEFPWGVDSLIARAVLERLRGAAPLQQGGWNINLYEFDGLLLEDTFSPPEIAVILEATDEEPKGSNRGAEVTTLVQLYIVRTLRSKAGTESLYLSRVINYIKGLLWENFGRLEDGGGGTLTCGLVRFQRVPGSLSVGGGKLIATRLRVAYTSKIQQRSREWS